MSFAEKPPILSGNNRQDIANLRDYLFRMARSLEPVANTGSQNLAVRYQNGKQIVVPTGGGGADSADIEKIRRNATELRDLILKTGQELDAEEGARATGDATVTSYVDSKTETYSSMFLAKSEFGTFQENITSMIETTARGVVESYDYASAIQSTQNSVNLLQGYYTSIEGEIRRGIVLDPDTNEYVTGIAIAQNLKFSGECGPTDPENPGDGYTYYYMNSGQTFGLYTSTGWQFWIGGHRKGWYNSRQETLYVENLQVADKLRVGGTWQMKSTGDELEITYVGS